MGGALLGVASGGPSLIANYNSSFFSGRTGIVAEVFLPKSLGKKRAFHAR